MIWQCKEYNCVKRFRWIKFDVFTTLWNLLKVITNTYMRIFLKRKYSPLEEIYALSVLERLGICLFYWGPRYFLDAVKINVQNKGSDVWQWLVYLAAAWDASKNSFTKHNENILHKYFWYWLKQHMYSLAICMKISWKKVN